MTNLLEYSVKSSSDLYAIIGNAYRRLVDGPELDAFLTVTFLDEITDAATVLAARVRRSVAEFSETPPFHPSTMGTVCT